MAELDLSKLSVSKALEPLEAEIVALNAQAVSLANQVKEFPTSRDLDDHISELQTLSGQIKAAENKKAEVLAWLEEKLGGE
jgi:predicted  nucleic acid-binding Zn-ribbon protein